MRLKHFRPIVFAAALLIACCWPGALGASLPTMSVGFTEVSPLIVAAPAYPAVNSPPFLAPSVEGFGGVAMLVVHRTDGSFICSGALISSTLVLTAAHCLSNTAGHVTTTSVDAYFYPAVGATVVVTATSGFSVNPSYNGMVASNYDIALVRLPRSPGPDFDVYGLYSGDVLGSSFTVVGFGRRGDGATGDTQPSGLRRQGFNVFDFYNTPGVLVSDFDDGTALHDASCYINASLCNLGLGSLESSTAPGDSGGPAFIGNRIVAVTAFGARLDSPPDIDSTIDSSFGEFAGFTSVAYNERWLDSNMPEPTLYPLAALALAGIVALSRRRRAG